MSFILDLYIPTDKCYTWRSIVAAVRYHVCVNNWHFQDWRQTKHIIETGVEDLGIARNYSTMKSTRDLWKVQLYLAFTS